MSIDTCFAVQLTAARIRSFVGQSQYNLKTAADRTIVARSGKPVPTEPLTG